MKTLCKRQGNPICSPLNDYNVWEDAARHRTPCKLWQITRSGGKNSDPWFIIGDRWVQQKAVWERTTFVLGHYEKPIALGRLTLHPAVFLAKQKV